MDQSGITSLVERAASSFSALAPRYSMIPSFWLGRDLSRSFARADDKEVAKALKEQFYFQANPHDLERFSANRVSYEIDVLQRFNAVLGGKHSQFFKDLNEENHSFFGNTTSSQRAHFYSWVLQHPWSAEIIGEWYGSLIAQIAPEVLFENTALDDNRSLGSAVSKRLDEQYGIDMNPHAVYKFYQGSVLDKEGQEVLRDILKARKEEQAGKIPVKELDPRLLWKRPESLLVRPFSLEIACSETEGYGPNSLFRKGGRGRRVSGKRTPDDGPE